MLSKYQISLALVHCEKKDLNANELFTDKDWDLNMDADTGAY